MAINIYDELSALSARVAKLEAASTAQAMRVGAVSYFRPGPLWDATLAQAPALTMINPGSGPGLTASASYVEQVNKARALHVPVFGYVHTKYGLRPMADVKADIAKHFTWYGVDGIFVDTTSNLTEHLPYYQALCDYVHAKGGKVCLNPGTKGPEEHALMADYVMVAETYWATYQGQARPAWEAKYPGKLWHCIHTCPAAEMPAAVQLAKHRGAGLVFVTDDIMPNPYNVLPTYWDAFCAAVRAA